MTSATPEDLPKGARSGKILFLEAVRGIASLIVVLQHLVAADIPAFEEFSRTYLDLGRVGVVAFFIVSGYVIPLSLERQSGRVFVIRRFYRLFPAYWFALAAFLVFGLLTAPDTIADQGPIVLMINVLMIQGLLPIATIVPTAWTLGIELVFYAQAFIARTLGKLGPSLRLGYVWLALYGAIQIVSLVTGRDLPTTPPLLLYTAAIGQALFARDKHGSTEWKLLTGVGIVLVPLFAYLGGGHDPEWPPLTYSSSYLLGLALFALFYFSDRLSSARWLVWFGSVSYALYLLHPLAYRATSLLGLPPIANIPLSIAVSIVISWALHRFIEQPFIALGRSKTRSSEKKPSDTTKTS
jgi:peptidoglycan/LPS O-acetylase OafA/YrhL